jgi:hypothetical protein
VVAGPGRVTAGPARLPLMPAPACGAARKAGWLAELRETACLSAAVKTNLRYATADTDEVHNPGLAEPDSMPPGLLQRGRGNSGGCNGNVEALRTDVLT